MKIAFMGASGTGKSTLANWLVSPQGPRATRGLPICPVGSRSTAKALGFVGPDGEGRPYDVDRANLAAYKSARMGGRNPQEAATFSMLSMNASGPTVRPLFQEQLAEDKIAWETNGPWSAGWAYNDKGEQIAKWGGFITDRTPLDDAAYAVMHCREVVTADFLARAYAHTHTYDLIVFCPLDVFSATAGDPARVADRQYHMLYEVVLGGLLVKAEQSCSLNVLTLGKPSLEDRRLALIQAVDRLR